MNSFSDIEVQTHYTLAKNGRNGLRFLYSYWHPTAVKTLSSPLGNTFYVEDKASLEMVLKDYGTTALKGFFIVKVAIEVIRNAKVKV